MHFELLGQTLGSIGSHGSFKCKVLWEIIEEGISSQIFSCSQLPAWGLLKYCLGTKNCPQEESKSGKTTKQKCYRSAMQEKQLSRPLARRAEGTLQWQLIQKVTHCLPRLLIQLRSLGVVFIKAPCLKEKKKTSRTVMIRHNLCCLGGRLLLWINVEAMVYPGLQKRSRKTIRVQSKKPSNCGKTISGG